MGYQLYHGDCLEIMPTLESGSVNLIACDLPYYKVIDAAWDSTEIGGSAGFYPSNFAPRRILIVSAWQHFKRIVMP